MAERHALDYIDFEIFSTTPEESKEKSTYQLDKNGTHITCHLDGLAAMVAFADLSEEFIKTFGAREAKFQFLQCVKRAKEQLTLEKMSSGPN